MANWWEDQSLYSVERATAPAESSRPWWEDEALYAPASDDNAGVLNHLGGLWDRNSGALVEATGGLMQAAGELPRDALNYVQDAAGALGGVGSMGIMANPYGPMNTLDQVATASDARHAALESDPNALTRLGRDVASTGEAISFSGQQASQVRRPSSIFDEPLQAAGYYANEAAGSAVPLAIAIAAPEVGLPLFGAQAFGGEYDKRRGEGVDPFQSAGSATLHAAAEVIPESAALKVLTGKLSAPIRDVLGKHVASAVTTNPLVRAGAGAIAEGGSEVATQIAQDATDIGMGDDISLGQMGERAKDAFMTGAALGGPLAGAHATLQSLAAQNDPEARIRRLAEGVIGERIQTPETQAVDAGRDAARAIFAEANISNDTGAIIPDPRAIDFSQQADPDTGIAPAGVAPEPMGDLDQQLAGLTPQPIAPEAPAIDREALLADLAEPELIRGGTRVFYRGDVPAMRARLAEAGLTEGMRKRNEDGADEGLYFPARMRAEVDAVLRRKPSEDSVNQPEAVVNEAPAAEAVEAVPEIPVLRSQRKQEDEDQRPDKPTDEGIESSEISGEEADRLIADMQQRQQRDMDERADPLTEGFKTLATNPDTFRTQLLPGKTIRELTEQSGTVYAGQTNKNGTAVHSVAVGQGAAGPATAQIYDDGNDVWVNVSDLTSGGGKGDAIYNMAYSYARNNGRNFIEDKEGVSDSAMYRRPVQQLSALLKSGDADNIAPGDFLATQRPGGPNTRPIKAPANRAFDPTLRENILTTYTNALNAVPEIGEIRYDTNRAAFVNASGELVTDADFDRLAGHRRANPIREAMVRVGDTDAGQRIEPAPVGGNSLKVAVLAQTLLGASPSQRPALLDGLRKIAAGSLGDSGLSRILPSKNKAPADAGVSRSEPLTRAAIDADVKRVFGTAKPLTRLINNGTVSLITKAEAIKRGLGTAKSLDGVKGLHDGTKGYLITDELRPDEVAGVLLHEIGVHHSMERILGKPVFDRLQKAVESFAARGDKDVLKAQKAVPADTPAEHKAHETLAYLSEQSANHTLVERMTDGTKLFLNRIGIPMSWIKAEPAAIRKIARESLLAEARRGDGSVRYNGRDTLYQKVYHGTPHRDIEKTGFSLQKIGSGEGAQAYGWGMYFAKQRDIAEHYRDTSKGHIKISGESFVPRNYGVNKRVAENADDFTAMRKALVDYVKYDEDHPNPWGFPEDARKVIEAIDNGTLEKPGSGQLYHAEIPDDHDLLDWDKPLSEQPEKVRAALRRSIANLEIEGESFWERDLQALDAFAGGNKKVFTGADLYADIIEALGSRDSRSASEYLNSIGIPGLRYLDGTSRGNGDGSHNYVIWDETLLTPEKAQITPYYSKRTDDEDQTQTAEFKRWFGDSKVVDAEGKPLVVYHGTEAGAFNQFIVPAFFTSDQGGAEWFMQGDNGRMESAYLSIQNPLDISTRNGSLALVRIARATGVDIDSDIEDGKDGWDFFAPEIGEHSNYEGNNVPDLIYIPRVRDALIAAGYDGLKVSDTLESTEIPVWVAFRPEQIKSATGNNGTFDATNPSILKSKRTEEQERDLIVTHNLTAEKLNHAIRMGGIAVPSLAVTKGDSSITGFGDITLIGDKGLADPRGGAKAFGADVYSPRYPSVQYKLDRPALKALNDALAPYRGDGGREIYSGEITHIGDLTQIPAFKAYAAAEGSDKGNYSDLKRIGEGFLREVGANEVLFGGFTNSGKRRYKPHTLENVVAELKKELRGGEGFNYGTGSLRAKFTPQFRSVEQIKKGKDRLTTEEDFSAVKEEVETELFSIVDELRPHSRQGKSLSFTDTVMAVMEDAPRMGIQRALASYDMSDVPSETQSRIGEFLTRLRNMPTEYFEVIQPRAVQVDEFRAAVIPDNTKPEVRDELTNRGLAVVEYAHGDEVARRAAVKKAAEKGDLMFSRRTPADAERDAAAKRAVAVNTLGGPATGGAIGWNFDAGEWEGKSGTARRARAALDDKMIAWRDVQDSIAEHLGNTVPDAQNVYRLENLMHGRVKEGIDALEEKQVVPLVKAMQESKITPAMLEEYLYALHAKERNAQIAKINPKMPDGGSGMTNAEADAILAKPLPGGMKSIAKRAQAIVRQTRKRLLDHGIITQDQFDAMESQYQNYVPLRGKTVGENEFDSGGSGAGRGIDGRPSPVKQAFGRGAGNRAENILGEIIGDAQRSIIAAEKARVGRAVMRIVLANPNPKLWTVEPVLTERKLDATGEVYEAVVQDWSDPSIVAVRHRGQVYLVQINHAPLAKALNLVGVDQIGPALRAAGAVNRYFSAVLTRYNPAFIPVNAARDALFGLTGLAVEHGELTAMKAAMYYPKAIRAAWREARRLPPKSEADTYAREFAEDGGKTGYVSMPSVEELQRKIGNGKFGGYSPQGIGRAAQAVGDLVGAMNDSVENALRLSAYVTLREQGMAREKAASYAKELTVNFNRKGSEGSKLNAWFLFYNASMQGIKRTGDLMKHPKTWGYLGALTAAQIAAVMYAMGQEDDEGTPIWDKVPDHVKQRNIVFTWLDDEGDQKILTIPMPYGFNVFPYLAGRIADGVMHAENRPRDRAMSIAADTVSAAVQSFSPVPLSEGPVGFVPEALGIVLGIQVNRDDFGRPIRKENPFGKFDVPRSSMGKPDTLELFKLAATGLNRIGGGDDRTPPPMGVFDVAPEDIEFILEKLGGGTGKFIIDMATVGQKAAGELPVEARDVPIAKRFFTNVNEPAAQQAMFYDRRDTLERNADLVRDTYEKDGPEAAIALLKATPSLSGADFRRYKRADPKAGHRKGGIVVVEKRPQLVVRRPDSVYGRYKEAAEATSEINETMRNAYTSMPGGLGGLVPNRERDSRLKELADRRMEAQKAFNAAWNRDVVGGE